MANKKRIKLSEIGDSLVLYYGSKESRIDSSTFINSLIGLNEILEATNSHFHPTQKITINIEAIAPGSFKAKISQSSEYLTKLFESAKKELENAPIVTILALIAIFHSNGSTQITNNTYNIVINKDVTEIHSKNLIIEMNSEVYNTCTNLVTDNDKVIKGINKHFKALSQDKFITDFQLLSQMEDGDVLYKSTADQFKSLIISDKEETREIEEDVTLTVYAPVLSDAKRKWEFVWNGNDISAYIEDKEFFEKMKLRRIGFMQGDVIDVTLKRKQKFNPQLRTYLDDSYEIVKVRSEPRAVTGEQISFNEVQENEPLSENKPEEEQLFNYQDDDDNANRVLQFN